MDSSNATLSGPAIAAEPDSNNAAKRTKRTNTVRERAAGSELFRFVGRNSLQLSIVLDADIADQFQLGFDEVDVTFFVC